MNRKDHLPLIGVGPLYVLSVIVFTIIGTMLYFSGVLDSGKIQWLKIPFIILGLLFILLGITLWITAFFQSKLDYNIKNNILITTGVYAYVRNPIYSAFAIVCTGILFLMYNL